MKKYFVRLVVLSWLVVLFSTAASESHISDLAGKSQTFLLSVWNNHDQSVYQSFTQEVSKDSEVLAIIRDKECSVVSETEQLRERIILMLSIVAFISTFVVYLGKRKFSK